jgi:hypothetical protein
LQIRIVYLITLQKTGVAISDFLSDGTDDKLTQQDVAEKIEEWTGVEPVSRSNGPRFYARHKGGKPERGTLFAAVLPGPRLYIDPTGKISVFGQTPKAVREHPDFEETASWQGSFRYSMMLDSEIPDVAQLAVEWSYGLFLEEK